MKLWFANFIGIYIVMKLQCDYKRGKDYYICIASVYLMVKKLTKLNINGIHFWFTVGISFRPERNQRH